MPPPDFDPIINQLVRPLILFYDIHLRSTNTKIFLKALSASIFTYFEECATKKRNFLVNIFHKVPKNGFFDMFFQNFACGVIFPSKWGLYSVWEGSGSQYRRPKKRSTNF